MVLPSEASFFFQDTERVRLGRKSSITDSMLDVGIRLAQYGDELCTCGDDLGLPETVLDQ
jgi:hypothetical protein